MQITEQQYEQLVFGDPAETWELVRGRPRKKQGMTTRHNWIGRALTRQLWSQLDDRVYGVAENSARLRISTGTFYVPDVAVIPLALARQRDQLAPASLEIYAEPVPLVVEIWSPRTGDYDVDDKLREYQLRGDDEIWRIHPHERTLTAWRRQSTGDYRVTLFTSGPVHPIALPGIVIGLEQLFAVL